MPALGLNKVVEEYGFRGQGRKVGASTIDVSGGGAAHSFVHLIEPEL